MQTSLSAEANDVHIVILAAGASSRMAPRDKLLESVDGQPLLARLTRFAVETECWVSVVLPPNRPFRLAALAGLPVHRVIAQQAEEGMAESLKAGLHEVPPERDVLVLLADLPEITLDDLLALLAARKRHPGKVLRAVDDSGTPGHPVLIPAALRPALLKMSGDQGAKAILAALGTEVVPVPLPGRHATTDLDSPEDWATWRERRQSGG